VWWSRKPRVLASLIAAATALTGAQTTVAQERASEKAEAEIDAEAFFDGLIERYRHIQFYLDVVEAEYTTARDDEDPHRVSSRLVCRVEGDVLRVESAAAQVREGLGIDSLTRSPAVEALVLRYNLWLAPHMALKFSENPRRDFRLGVSAGFSAEKASVMGEDVPPRVRLELVERTPEESEALPARFVLWVNLETMLVERIEGEQFLPDGARYTTTLRITPREVVPAGESTPEA
jgi:hypothetical protein